METVAFATAATVAIVAIAIAGIAMFYLGDCSDWSFTTVATGAVNGNLEFEFTCDCSD